MTLSDIQLIGLVPVVLLGCAALYLAIERVLIWWERQRRQNLLRKASNTLTRLSPRH